MKAIGRSLSAMATYVRVTGGTPEQMAKFQAAFVKCMEMTPAPVSTASLHVPEHHIPTALYRG